MKRIILFLVVLLFTTSAMARMEKGDLDKKVTTSSGAMVLMQADIVSLHFTNSGVAYTPSLRGSKIHVKGTVVNEEMMENSSTLKSTLKRQVRSFSREMNKRVRLYAPTISKKFNAYDDMIFVIRDKRKQEIGTCKDGKWSWKKINEVPATGKAAAAVPVTAPIMDPAAPVEKNYWCDCPSLIGKNKNKKPKIKENDLAVEKEKKTSKKK